MPIDDTLMYAGRVVSTREGALPENIEFAQTLKQYLLGMHQNKALRILTSVANARKPIVKTVEKEGSLEYIAKLPELGLNVLALARNALADQYNIDIDLAKDRKAKVHVR
jgi:hypothetical protein